MKKKNSSDTLTLITKEIEEVLHKWNNELVLAGNEKVAFDCLSIALCSNFASFLLNSSEKGKAIDNLEILAGVIKSIIEQKQK